MITLFKIIFSAFLTLSALISWKKTRDNNFLIISGFGVVVILFTVFQYINNGFAFFSSNILIILLLVIINWFDWKRFKNKINFWVLMLSIVLLFASVWNSYFKLNSDVFFSEFVIISSIVEIFIGIVFFIILIFVIANNLDLFFPKKTTFRNFPKNYLKINLKSSDGFPIIGFINQELWTFAEKKKYPYFLVLHYEISQKNQQGMPTDKEEIQALDSHEEDMEMKLKSVCDIYFIAQVTTKGFRYAYYHINDDKNAQTVFNEMADKKYEKLTKFYASLVKDENWEKVMAYFKKFKAK